MNFKTIKGDGGIIKPDSILNPLIGVLIAKEQGKFSPIYVIRDANDKIHKIRGCKDLDSKLARVSEGATISLQYVKSVPTNAGNAMVIMDVKIATDNDDPENEPNISEQDLYPTNETEMVPCAPVNVANMIQYPELPSAEEIKINPLARFGIQRK